MIVLTNAYEGRTALHHQTVCFEEEREKIEHFERFGKSRRIGIWRIRPKTQAAFQTMHLRACMS